MSAEQNIATQENLGASVSSGNLDNFEEIFAPNVIDHDPASDQGPGPQGFRDMSMRTAFPDLNVEVEHMVTDDENVAIAYVINGTHQGDFEGIAPTGKAIQIRGMQIARFENGLIFERWGSSDELGILKTIQSE